MMISPLRHGALRNRSYGLAAVEFTFVVPVVLFLLLACAEIGRAMYQYNTLTKAVRNGAIYAGQVALDPGTDVMELTGTKQTAARNVVVYGTPSASGTPVLPSLVPGTVAVTAPNSTHVQVSVSYPYITLFGGTIPSFGQGPNVSATMNLNATCTVRAL